MTKGPRICCPILKDLGGEDSEGLRGRRVHQFLDFVGYNEDGDSNLMTERK